MRRRCGRWLWPYPEQHSCSNANICDYFANRKYQGLQAYLIELQLLLEIQGENRFHAIIWISFTELVTNDKEHSVGILDFLKQEEFMFHENHVLMKIDFNYPLKKKKTITFSIFSPRFSRSKSSVLSLWPILESSVSTLTASPCNSQLLDLEQASTTRILWMRVNSLNIKLR